MSEVNLGGGTYIVRTNEYGGTIKEYGWASIKIINGNIIKILCDDNLIGHENLCIYTFQIKNKIPNDYKYNEHIHIMLQRGFNAKLAYNFSAIDSFKRNCESYFRDLDKKLELENEKVV
jgi:hypothetical protein